MVTLVCALVGVKGNMFPVDIEASKMVGHLKKVIAEDQKYAFAASKLELFLARKGDNTWLNRDGAEALTLDKHGHPEGFTHMDPLLWIKNPKNFGDNFEPKEGEIHVLVVVPSHGVGGKRVRVEEWFVDEAFLMQEKKRKLGEDETDQSTRYFNMAGFPPLAQPTQYGLDCYRHPAIEAA